MHDNEPEAAGGGNVQQPAAERRWTSQRLAELERCSLLAEQARQLAHALRSPLSVVGLIGETLQVELTGDDDKRRRLDQLLGSVSRVSSILSETVNDNRFADGPRRPEDPAAMAAELVRLRGGRAELDGCSRQMLLEPDGFAAAILHALHLVQSNGTGGNTPAGRDQPVLRCTMGDGMLTLDLTGDRDESDDAACAAGADRGLMIKAAERVARDHDGSLTMEPGRATFRFPLAPGQGRR